MRFSIKAVSAFILLAVLVFADTAGLAYAAEPDQGTASGEISFLGTLFEIPIELPYGGVHYQRKKDAIYVNGNFVVSGECGGGIGAEKMPASAQVSFPPGGGLWVFSESGNFVAERSVCRDTGGRIGVSHHSIGTTRLWGNNSGFVAQTNFIELGPSNAAIYYTLSGSSLTQQSRILTSDYSLDSPALTNEELVSGSVFKQDIREHGVGIFDLPGLQEERFIETSTNITPRPAVALGEYIVGTGHEFVDGKNSWTPYVVYKVNNGVLEVVQELAEVQDDMEELSDNRPPGYIGRAAFDYTANPGRIAFWNVIPGRDSSDSIFIYEYTPSGLSFVEEREVPNGSTPVSGQYDLQNTFAIAGDTLAFPTEDGEFEAWKGGQKIGEGQLPPTKSYFELNSIDRGSYGSRKGERTPHRLIISPSGNILVLNEFGAYLYRIGPGGTPPPPPPDGTPPPGGTTPPPQSVIGQSLNVTFNATSTAPQALIRFASVLGATPQGLSISVFGKTFEVYTAGARILNRNWAPTGIQEILASPFVNVWGNLDTASSTIIQGITVRNPLPPTPGAQNTTAPQSTLAPQSAPTYTAAPVTNAAARSTLDSLRQILQGLQTQVGQ